MSTRDDNHDTRNDAWVERVVYGIVLVVLAVVPLLAFIFSFGNVGKHGADLGAGRNIAYLTGPAVDLSVTGLIVAATWLSHRGWTEKQLWPIHLTSVACGLIMFWLNCGQAIIEHHWRLAVFDAVGPFLLIVMGFVGPWLLRQLAAAKQSSAVAITEESASDNANPVATTEPTTPTAKPAAPPTPVANDNPAPVDKRQDDKKPVAKTKPAAKPASDNGANADDIHAATMLPIYRQILEKTGKRPSGPALAKAVPGIGSESRAKQIREIVEDRWHPEMKPRFHLVKEAEPLEQVS